MICAVVLALALSCAASVVSHPSPGKKISRANARALYRRTQRHRITATDAAVRRVDPPRMRSVVRHKRAPPIPLKRAQSLGSYVCLGPTGKSTWLISQEPFWYAPDRWKSRLDRVFTTSQINQTDFPRMVSSRQKQKALVRRLDGHAGDLDEKNSISRRCSCA